MLLNKYAAIPSMHIAFSLLIAVPAANLVNHRLPRLLWFAYPPTVLFVIVATGNHFWIDAVAGAAVAGVAAVAALQLARLRPAAWSWRSGRATA